MTNVEVNKIQELKEQVSILKDNLLTYKMQARGGALKTTHLIKITRRDIARILHTIQQEEYLQAFSMWLANMEAQCDEECPVEA